jgi:hypothetical protein
MGHGEHGAQANYHGHIGMLVITDANYITRAHIQIFALLVTTLVMILQASH